MRKVRTFSKLACMAPAFLLCIGAYSYVKCEALKACYALGGNCSAHEKSSQWSTLDQQISLYQRVAKIEAIERSNKHDLSPNE